MSDHMEPHQRRQQQTDKYERALLLLPLRSLAGASKEEGTARALASLVSQSVALCSEEVVVLLSCPELVPRDQCGSAQAPGPPYVWKHLQRVLALLYGAAGERALEEDKPLLRFDVVPDWHCARRSALRDSEGKRPPQVVLMHSGDGEELEKLQSRRLQEGLSKLPSRSLTPQACLPERSSRLRNIGETTARPPFSKRDHAYAAVGGTFDHLHVGHKILLTMAAWVPSETLFCGVTSASMLKSKINRELLQPEEVRLTEARNFLQRIRPQIRYQVEIIDDPCGPAASDGTFSALVVSHETLSGGEFGLSKRFVRPETAYNPSHSVNSERAKRGLDPLEIFVIDVLAGAESESTRTDGHFPAAASPYADKLSSTFIRGWLKSKSEKQRLERT
ncbi:MAG: hypothetical protein BJ554DRAFT_3896 [Olpidium bornovanus]|uniref:Cytidyltransferase-like domain-containing protein n=1 Tax=Olpidium bornovanus TaxID=278681 RepID=A0A8H7ZNI3_9FUNG|nr:MAG: hypothetical protein BJ554DRAFT_3896 [Olpidium bornovanus]